jgi:hypothetical protein
VHREGRSLAGVRERIEIERCACRCHREQKHIAAGHRRDLVTIVVDRGLHGSILGEVKSVAGLAARSCSDVVKVVYAYPHRCQNECNTNKGEKDSPTRPSWLAEVDWVLPRRHR